METPFEMGKLEKNGTVLNSELNAEEAIERATEEVMGLHQYIALRDIDKILNISTEVKIAEKNYLHVSIWFVTYEYKWKLYKMFLDGASEEVIIGKFPRV